MISFNSRFKNYFINCYLKIILCNSYSISYLVCFLLLFTNYFNNIKLDNFLSVFLLNRLFESIRRNLLSDYPEWPFHFLELIIFKVLGKQYKRRKFISKNTVPYHFASCPPIRLFASLSNPSELRTFVFIQSYQFLIKGICKTWHSNIL